MTTLVCCKVYMCNVLLSELVKHIKIPTHIRIGLLDVRIVLKVVIVVTEI